MFKSFQIWAKKNRPPDKGRPIYLTYRRDCSLLVEKESHTGAHQLLAQSAILVGIDLGALIIEVFILDKRAPLGIEKVIDTGNHIERQVRVTCSATSVDWDSASYGVINLDPSRFSIVNADARTEIRLELLVSRCESQNEVRQERARIDPSGHVALC